MVRSILSVNATGLSCAATRLLMRVALFFSAIGTLSFARQYRPRIKCDRNKVLKLRATGKSLGAISRELGISKTTVHRIVEGSC